jgi:hypothetical protein
MMDTGISADVAHGTTHLPDVAADGEVAPPGPERRHPLRSALALVIGVLVGFGVLISIALFLAPLASAAGGCGGG